MKMKKKNNTNLFERVVSILERAKYGRQLIESLSEKLTRKYGRGFSITNLRYFRTFYTTYSDRQPEIRQIGSGEFGPAGKRHTQSGVLADMSQSVEQTDRIRGFSPSLGWSHYQALMGVDNPNERLFYEIEAEKEGWEVKHLQRQIHSFLFARLLKSKDKAAVMAFTRQGQTINTPADTIKNPYILDFLGLPDSPKLHEGNLEAAIIANLQSFLLELGKKNCNEKSSGNVDSLKAQAQLHWWMRTPRKKTGNVKRENND